MTRSPVALLFATQDRQVVWYYLDTIANLRARGFAVHVVCSPGTDLDAIHATGAHVHPIPMEREIAPIKDLRTLPLWLRLVRDIKPALAIGGTPKAGLVGMTVSALCRVPTRTYMLHGLRLEGATGAQRRLLGALEMLTSRAAHRVVAVSPSLAAVFEAGHYNAGRPVLVPGHGSSHGVDSARFAPRPRDVNLAMDLGLAPDLPTILYLGRLTGDKGATMLRETIERVAEQMPAQLLCVGGTGDLDSATVSASLAAARAKVVMVEHAVDVVPYLSLADVLVLPTRREGMPNVVLEAAAMEIPSVTTRVTGATDSVIDAVTGYLVDYGDSAAMADRVVGLLRDPTGRRAMGSKARERVLRDFRPQDVARTIVDLTIGTGTPGPGQ